MYAADVGEGGDDALLALALQLSLQDSQPRGAAASEAADAELDRAIRESLRDTPSHGPRGSAAITSGGAAIPADAAVACGDVNVQSKARAKNRKRRGKKREATSRAQAADAAQHPVLVWFRQDLRLHDNPALHAAAASGRPVVPVFVLEPADEEGPAPMGGASKLWLHHSLRALDRSLREHCASRLTLLDGRRAGGTCGALVALAAECNAGAIFFNRVYEPWRQRRDDAVCEALRERGVEARSHSAMLLYEPHVVRPDEFTPDGTHKSGFCSVAFFLEAARALGPPPEPLPPVSAPLRAPSALPGHEAEGKALLAHLARMPRRPDGSVVDWGASILSAWAIGERGGLAALDSFIRGGADSRMSHFEGRERFRADRKYTSVLSPHIHFGELSVRRVFATANEAHGKQRSAAFLRRFGWRDMAYWFLWRFPSCARVSFRPQYERQAWCGGEEGKRRLTAWQRGRTGYPLVDAAMRQLWRTGWLPNYLRHVTAQFLVEYLNLHWRHGLDWYHNTLVDCDVAIQAYMWQNGGHSGPDQWNFVMHPIFAAKSCDPDGEYTRLWLPVLARLPTEFIHCPWEAPKSMLSAAGVRLGADFPQRVVVDLEQARLASHKAVLDVRRSEEGRRHMNGRAEFVRLPSRGEYEDESEPSRSEGLQVYLISRKDYAKDEKTADLDRARGTGAARGPKPGSWEARQGSLQSLTRQTAADKWDGRRRSRADPSSRAMEDMMRAGASSGRGI